MHMTQYAETGENASPELLAQMTKHGIQTSAADYWLHLHPLDSDGPTIYFYAVPLMLEFIAVKALHIKKGHSKDSSITGAGYLVPKVAFPIQSATVPDHYVGGFDWRGASNREAGLYGELIVGTLIEHGIVRIPMRRVSLSRSARAQFDGYDGLAHCFADAKWEAKVETFHSGNLFVQTHERGHKPNLVLSDGKIIERMSALRPLEQSQ